MFAVADVPVPIDLADPRFLTTGIAAPSGIPRAGREREYALLWETGRFDLACGRLYEGHVNALQLIAHYGSDAQRREAERDAADGRLFGVWNTQPADGVRITAIDGDGVTLAGRKTFCSGAGRVTRAMITGSMPQGGSQMLLVPMDRVAAAIDRTFWRPMGMADSDSFAVDFSGIRLPHSALVGTPDAYMEAPWFTGGAARFLAVQGGGIERLCDELAAFLIRRGTSEDALQLVRLGAISVALESARLWVAACVRDWRAFDAAPGAALRDALLTTVDTARIAVEDAALAVCEQIERAVGARGLVEPEPFGPIVRDLRMYLRQPAPDAALLRVANAVIARTRRI